MDSLELGPGRHFGIRLIRVSCAALANIHFVIFVFIIRPCTACRLSSQANQNAPRRIAGKPPNSGFRQKATKPWDKIEHRTQIENVSGA